MGIWRPWVKLLSVVITQSCKRSTCDSFINCSNIFKIEIDHKIYEKIYLLKYTDDNVIKLKYRLD